MTLTQAIAALAAHRDQHYAVWSRERGLLNFALWVLRQVEEAH